MSVTDTQTLAALINADALEEARSRALSDVKANPKSSEMRIAFAHLLAVMGDLERAETHARMAQQLAPKAATEIALLRQYLRALDARDNWWSGGAVPDLPLGPSEADRAALHLNLALAQGDDDAPTAAREALELALVPVTGTLNDTPLDGLRDLDDRLPHAFEALSPGGNYLWLDFQKVAELTLAPLTSTFDLIARPARVTLTDGSAADLRLPAIYDTPRSASESLARTTDFAPLTGGLTRAYGQRAFLAGEDMVALHDIHTLTLTHG